MAIRIEKDGWVISGSTVEELQIGIAAVRAELMSNGEVRTRRGPGRPPGPTHDKQEKRERGFRKRKSDALSFLELIDGTGTMGVSATKLTETLGLKSTKAIGAAALNVNKFLNTAEIDPESVYYTEKKYNQDKRWIRRQSIKEAIGTIKGLALDQD